MILGHSDAVKAFVAQLIPGCERGWSNGSAIGFADDGLLVAGVVYHNWSPETGVIELSAASTQRNWLNRERLKAIFAFPFDELNCRIAVARIAESNTRARRIWRSLGAMEIVIPELRTPTEAEVLYLLKAETWRKSKFSRQVHNG